MRISIARETAEDPAAHCWLDRIVGRIEDGWHVWDTTGFDDPAAMETSSWLREDSRQGARLRELWRFSVRRDGWSFAPHGRRLAPHGRRLAATASPGGPDELAPEEAVRLAEEPLVLLVENRESDGAFLWRAVTELDKPLSALWRRKGDPIRLDSVGGVGQMAQQVRRRAQQTSHRPRLVVVADSDRTVPGGQPSRAARRLARVCEDLDVPCWILAKREAENYLPRVLLDAKPGSGPDHADRVEAWDRLDEDQKDFVDMKNGLAGESSSTEEALFSSVSRDDRETLRNGFGEHVHICWSVWTVQARSELVGRSRGDLERGMQLIRSQA